MYMCTQANSLRKFCSTVPTYSYGHLASDMLPVLPAHMPIQHFTQEKLPAEALLKWIHLTTLAGLTLSLSTGTIRQDERKLLTPLSPELMCWAKQEQGVPVAPLLTPSGPCYTFCFELLKC